MDFKDIGFQRFLKTYATQQLDKTIKDAYNAGYEDGWRDKHAKNVMESPKNILFVFEQADECATIIKENLIDNIIGLKNHKIRLDDGTILYIHSPERIHNEALCGVTIQKAFIDSELKNRKSVEQEVLKYMEPKNSQSCFIPFSALDMIDFREL